MFFLGTTFFSGRHTLDPTPTSAKNIKNIAINNGTFEQIFVSKNPDLEVEAGYDDWNFDTVLNADYKNGKFDAGNSGFSLSNTEYVVIKCREVGTYDWTTIYTKKINKIADFKININDYFRPSKKDIEYMVVSVANGIENTYVTSTIHSEFDGLYVCDKDNIYGTLYNLDYMDTTRSVVSSEVELKNNSYPMIVSNNTLNYDKGTASGAFIRFNQESMDVDLADGMQYREDVKNWLNNKCPKILKFHDGRIWLIGITGEISDSGDDHNDIRKLSFEWTEIGNVKDIETLYNCGLSDVGKEWWY